MEPTEGSETSAALKLTPRKYPKEDIQHSKPDESLKSRYILIYILYSVVNLEIFESTRTECTALPAIVRFLFFFLWGPSAYASVSTLA
jgi:hypothetical protein